MIGVLELNAILFLRDYDPNALHWFCLACPVRLALIMAFGWPAVLSAVLSSFVVFAPGALESTALFGNLSFDIFKTIGLWGGLWFYGSVMTIRYPWDGLTWNHVPVLVIFTSMLSGLAGHTARLWATGGTAETLMQDLSLSVLGDILGIVVFLGVLLKLRGSFLRSGDRMD